MAPKFIALLDEAERALNREVAEARISALYALRWEFCRILDDLIANEEKNLDSQDEEECL